MASMQPGKINMLAKDVRGDKFCLVLVFEITIHIQVWCQHTENNALHVASYMGIPIVYAAVSDTL